MKKLPMIVAIIVSIFSAQGVVSQDELAYNEGFEYGDYEYELQEYTEINIVELPIVIQEVAARDFEKYRITKAFISKDNTYKVVLYDTNNNIKVLFADANGKWIKPDDNKS